MKKVKNIIIISMMLVLALSFALLGLSGCGLIGPQWRRDAVQAFRDAKFAPQLEEIVPSFLLRSNQVAANNPSTASPMSLSTNYISAADTIKSVDMGFVTLESEINSVRNRIDFANNLRNQIINEIGSLREYGEWINGIRLDILYCGTIEHRRKDVLTGYMRSLVRLNADRSKVEIVEFPIMIDSGHSAYLFARYSSYDGEVFIHMDSYEFFKPGSTEYFGSRHINYREYRNDEDGITTATLVQVGETLVDGFHGNPLGINTMDITVFGGNDEMIYRHWRRVNSDAPDVESFLVENDEAWVSVGEDGETYQIQVSVNMLNIARIFYEEEVTQVNDWATPGIAHSHLYLIVGVELNDGTIIEGAPYMYPWGGYVTHYLASNSFTAMIFATGITQDAGVHDAVNALGFDFIDGILCFESIINGDAKRMLDDVRMNRIENISDLEITINNAPKLLEEMFGFFESKFVLN